MKVTKTNRTIVINDLAYAEDLKRAAQCATLQTLISLGHVKPYVSQNEAQKLYGKANVNFWIKSGLLNKNQDGDTPCTIRINRMDLEALSQANNRCEWFMMYGNND